MSASTSPAMASAQLNALFARLSAHYFRHRPAYQKALMATWSAYILLSTAKGLGLLGTPPAAKKKKGKDGESVGSAAVSVEDDGAGGGRRGKRKAKGRGEVCLSSIYSISWIWI